MMWKSDLAMGFRAFKLAIRGLLTQWQTCGCDYGFEPVVTV